MDIEHLLWKIVPETVQAWTCEPRRPLRDFHFPVGIIAERMIWLAGEILNVNFTKSKLTLQQHLGVGYFPFAQGSAKS
jgi:hypothetical protein